MSASAATACCASAQARARLARFDRDVLSVPGATDVILLEGINDINRQFNPQYAERANADDIIAGYKQLIARAHAKGLRIHGGTLTPQGGYPQLLTARARRSAKTVNTWIRTSGAFDGVIDFEAAVRDPAKPEGDDRGLSERRLAAPRRRRLQGHGGRDRPASVRREVATPLAFFAGAPI
jgi:hypothetical protein